MYIEATGYDVSSEEFDGLDFNHGMLNGSKVTILDEENAINGIQFETRQKVGFSLEKIKVMMGKISVEYEHKNSDGSSDRIAIGYEAPKSETSSESSSPNNADNNQKDINSTDRDYDKDNGN